MSQGITGRECIRLSTSSSLAVVPERGSGFGQVLRRTRLKRRVLPLVKSLTELLGGNLDLVSTPGEGTTVTIHLPRGCIAEQQAGTGGKRGIAAP